MLKLEYSIKVVVVDENDVPNRTLESKSGIMPLKHLFDAYRLLSACIEFITKDIG